MLNSQLLERVPIKIVLLTLFIIEIFFIAANYNTPFQTYIFFVIIALLLPLLYLSYHYFTINNHPQHARRAQQVHTDDNEGL